MEQMRQNEAGALTAQAIPQKDVEQACFHALGLIGRNCEYLDQHLAHVGADQQTRQAVNDISAASARLDRTVNEVMSLLDFLRTEEDPRLYPLDLCQLLQQVAAQADMVQAQLGVELTLDYGGWTACRVMADRNDAELLCLHLLSNALRACSAGGKVRLMLRRSESFWQLTVLDTGCGEGYYTSAVYRALRDAGRMPCMAGTDISKAILRRAAKREKDVEFAVASSYHLPVADRSIDLLLNCFSPLALEEFRRALRPGGTFLYVVPSEKHLWELKQVLYDHPYPNEVKETPYEGFAYAEIRHVEDRIRVLGQEDIHALFQMTPYYWKTPKSGCQRLAALEELAVTISFDIHVFRREA